MTAADRQRRKRQRERAGIAILAVPVDLNAFIDAMVEARLITDDEIEATPPASLRRKLGEVAAAALARLSRVTV